MAGVTELNAAIPTIVFGARDQKGADISTVVVTMDGERIAEQLNGIAIDVDPGQHTFSFEVAGQPVVTKTLVVREAEKKRHETIVLGGSPAPAGPVPLAPTERAEVTGTTTTSSQTTGVSNQRLGALVAGGVGLAGVVVGAISGAVLIAKKDEMSKHCGPIVDGIATCSDRIGVDAGNTAKTMGIVSTIAWGTALAGLGVGAVLWWNGPKKNTQVGNVRIGLSGPWLEVQGSF